VIVSYVSINKPEFNVTVIKSFRVLRPIRTMARIADLKILLNTLVQAILRLGSASLVILFFYFVYSVTALQIFSGYLKLACFQ